MMLISVCSTLLLFYSQWVSGLIVMWEFRMLLIFVCLLHPIILLFIGCRWSDYHLGIQNAANLCLSAPPYYSLIHRM